LYNAAWRTIVYVDLNKTDNETLMMRQYVHHVEMLCQTTAIRNWTGCAHFVSDTRFRLVQLTKTEGLLREITGQETGNRRKKTGVFNFIGELSKWCLELWMKMMLSSVMIKLTLKTLN